jgi:hypothetical protein
MPRTVKGTGTQVAALLHGMAQRLRRGMYAAERQALRETKEDAQALSSGPYQPRDLARLGHPYAKRRFRPPAAPWIINRRRGRGGGAFYRGWRIFGPRKDGSGGYVSRLSNVAPEARFLTGKGTDRMGPRPIQERLAMLLARRRQERHAAALAEAFKPRR